MIYTFQAEAYKGGRTVGDRFEVDADSEPEAIYEGMKATRAWLHQNDMKPADLGRFDMVSIRR